MKKFWDVILDGHTDAKPLFQNLGGVARCGRGLLLASCAGLLGGAFPVVAHAADATHPAKKPFPQIVLEKHLRGDEAVRGLGNKLPEVADWYGMTPKGLTEMLRHDRMARLDRGGRLHFIDEHRPPEPAGTTESGTIAEAGAFPSEQTFLLHSRPGAKRVIYLDFNGQTVAGTAWNYSYGVNSIVAKPYDIDGDASTFSTAELDRIQGIWQRVAEDYAPFDVDVTTEEPPADAITRSASTDLMFGTRVLITRDWTKLTPSPCGCGGIAYVGVFDDYSDSYKPAWVFYDNLGGGHEKYVAEAISHEVGHNLGLSHDGTTTGSSYYTGHGSGATGWAPIMGAGYYKEVTQWSKGEYYNANLLQDDLQIIQNTGAPLRTDDHGDNLASATPIDATLGSDGRLYLSGGGLVSTRTDIDVFRFTSAAGALTLAASPGPRGSNLDIGLSLYDGAGNLLASTNPVDALSASLNLNLSQGGSYYVAVYGVGKGDLTTGYSDYASLGEYSLNGSVPASAGQPPVAVATATPISGTAPLLVNFSSAGSDDPDGDALSYDWDFGDGSTATTANPSHTYTAAGTYTASLRVGDPGGSSDTALITINVTAAASMLHVGNITMAMTVKRGVAQATATVSVLDANGKPISGATVRGAWTGPVTGTSSGITGSTGTVKLTSQSTKKTGNFTFTVTGVSLPGYVYSSSQNVETSDSISR